MIRFIFMLLLLVAAVLSIAWYSAQSLPAWFDADQVHQNQLVDKLSKQIEQKGVANFLGSKFADVMRGRLDLNETEFNAILHASLNSSRDGRRLLSVSDAINAQLTEQGIEIGAVINLQKLAALDSSTREAVEKVRDVLPLLDKSRVFLAVSGRPVARDGKLAFTEELSLKVGGIPLPGKILKQLGVPVERASESGLPISMLSIQSVTTAQDKISLGVLPRF